MIHYWKALDLEITDFEYHHDPTPSSANIPSQNLKHVEIIEFSNEPTYDISFERS